ncbi:hypothetical protein CW714_02985 [Methanophagales archaeon]|nr:MAG: hypothetical protein CW714_02985 [Methanophagales archaeon]
MARRKKINRVKSRILVVLMDTGGTVVEPWTAFTPQGVGNAMIRLMGRTADDAYKKFKEWFRKRGGDENYLFTPLIDGAHYIERKDGKRLRCFLAGREGKDGLVWAYCPRYDDGMEGGSVEYALRRLRWRLRYLERRKYVGGKRHYEIRYVAGEVLML